MYWELLLHNRVDIRSVKNPPITAQLFHSYYGHKSHGEPGDYGERPAHLCRVPQWGNISIPHTWLPAEATCLIILDQTKPSASLLSHFMCPYL